MDEELDHYKFQQIELTDDVEWDPSTVTLGITTKPVAPHTIRQAQSVKVKENGNLGGESELVLRSISEALVDKAYRELPIFEIEATSIAMCSAHGIVSATRHSKVLPDEMARKWGIGIETAKETLCVTTQRVIWQAIHPLHRRYRTDRLNLHVRRLSGQWHFDHLMSRRKSLGSKTGAWVYTNGKFTCVYPTASQWQVAETLKEFVDDVGIPEMLQADQAP
jgi:uncharacterized cupin superfamily protein